MRKNMPAYFEGAKTYFDNLESSELCDFVYGDNSDTQDQKLLQVCKTGLNGLLTKGLTNSFYYMYTQILK